MSSPPSLLHLVDISPLRTLSVCLDLGEIFLIFPGRVSASSVAFVLYPNPVGHVSRGLSVYILSISLDAELLKERIFFFNFVYPAPGTEPGTEQMLNQC